MRAQKKGEHTVLKNSKEVQFFEIRLIHNFFYVYANNLILRDKN